MNNSYFFIMLPGGDTLYILLDESGRKISDKDKAVKVANRRYRRGWTQLRSKEMN